MEHPRFIFCLSLPCPWHRQRKDELEQRMSALQESRRELMVQLEGLMKLLKVRILLLERRHFPPFPVCSGIPALLSHPKPLPEGQDRSAKSHSHHSSVWCVGRVHGFSRFVWVKYPEPQIWSGLTKLGLVTGAQPFPLSQGNKPGAGQDVTARDKELALHSPCHIWGFCLGVPGLPLSSDIVWVSHEGPSFLWAPLG